jgi:putative oxidoreductase
MSTIAAVIGRILLAVIFIVSGAGKLTHVPATEATIVAHGLPSGLAIPTGIFELVAGLCLVFGVMTRLVSVLLAGFIVLTVPFFHSNFADPMQFNIALMHLAMIGGMFLVSAHSQMWWSWDRMRAERRGEIAARRAEIDAREADLRAARAEGVAEGTRTAPVGARPVVVDEPVARPATVPGTVVADVDAGGVPEVRRRWF